MCSAIGCSGGWSAVDSSVGFLLYVYCLMFSGSTVSVHGFIYVSWVPICFCAVLMTVSDCVTVLLLLSGEPSSLHHLVSTFMWWYQCLLIFLIVIGF